MTTSLGHDKPQLSGATYLILSGLGFALVNAGVKFLPQIPPHEILFFRAVVSLVVTYFAIRALGLSPLGNNKPMLVMRGLLGTFGLLLYFHTLQRMPIASAVTIQYLHPILTVIVAAVFLKERPGRWQWLLFGVSFCGVFLVRGFDTRVSGIDLSLGLISAFITACSFTLIRALRHQDHALVVMFYLPLISFFVLGPVMLFTWVDPSPIEWAVLIGVGGLTQVSQYFLTKAYHLDTAANISNLNYLGIVYALAIGLIFFDEAVGPLSLLGMAIIGTSSLLSARFRTR